MTARPLAFAALLAATVLAGCSGASKQSTTEDPTGLVPVQDRNGLPFDVAGAFSRTLHNGTFGILDGVSVDVAVSLPPTSGAAGAGGLASTNLGLFLPDIPGCDWEAAELPAECQVPVIADIGPYYSSTKGVPDAQTEGDTVATEPANRLGRFLIENFVPHGYAVAQVSVLGTGDSSGCQDLMGRSEQAGIDAAVTWLGTQAWSNGAVGLIGRSYDGSTPWEAATFGNPHLKTIVPISGLTGVHELMYHNGSAESRGAGVLYALYAAMTVDGDASDAYEFLCPETLAGIPEGVGAYLTGSHNDAAGLHPYWADRYFLGRALENYNGSVYLIHGLQDWNVDPHMAFPAYQQLQDAGLEVKGLFGQWGHMYPDRPGEHRSLGPGRGQEAYPESVRYDWAQDLLEWFDHYLKGTGPQPQLHAEVQDNQGNWRIEATWPPQDLAWTELEIAGAGQVTADCDPCVTYELEPTAEDLRIAGLAQLRLNVRPTGPGGQVYARLETTQGMHLGHAILEFRSQGAQPVVPASTRTVFLEFEPMDVLVPAGTPLRLTLAATGEDYLPSPVSAPVLVESGGALLRLPTVPAAHGIPFTPPAWSGDADATAQQP